MSLKQTLAAAAVAVTAAFIPKAYANPAECEPNWINSSAVSKTLFTVPVAKWQTQEIAKLGPSTLASVFKDTEKLPRALSRDVDSVFKPLERAVAREKEINWDAAKKDAHVSFSGVLDRVQSGELSMEQGRQAASVAVTGYVGQVQTTLAGIQGAAVPCLVAP